MFRRRKSLGTPSTEVSDEHIFFSCCVIIIQNILDNLDDQFARVQETVAADGMYSQH
jgi:hypothetical protein